MRVGIVVVVAMACAVLFTLGVAPASADGPSFSDPRPVDGGGMLPDDSVEISIFAESTDGFNNDYEFRNATDDSVIAVVTSTGNDRVSATWENISSGTNEWYVYVNETDQDPEYSDVYSFEMSDAGLVFKNEDENEILYEHGINLELQGIEGDDSIRTVQKPAYSEILDISHLPGDRYAATARQSSGSPDLNQRKKILKTDADHTIWMNEPDNLVEAEFILDDDTGTFSAENTEIYLRRPLPPDNDTQSFGAITSGEFDASDSFVTRITEEVRHTIRIENDKGQTRQTGFVEATTNRIITLDVGSIEWRLGEEVDEGLTWEASRTEDETLEDEIIRVLINDSVHQLTDLDVRIYKSANESVEIYNETHAGPLSELSITQQIPTENQNVTSWTVEWSADRDGEGISARTLVGGGEYPVTIPAGSEWVGLFSALFLAFVAGFFSVRVAELGAVITPIVALGLFAAGWLPLPLSWVLAALTLGVATEFGRRGGFSNK